MFSSSGYFRGVNCPYFASGLCERPYCHFRHSRNDTKDGDSSLSRSLSLPDGIIDDSFNIPGSSTDDKGPPQRRGSLLNMVSDAIRQVENDIEKDKAKLERLKKGILTPGELEALGKAENDAKSSKPEKTDAPNSYKATPVSTDTKKSSGFDKPKLVVPSYKPTPIRVLKKQVKGADSATEEYDPTSNFATVKSRGAKRTISSDNVSPEKKQKFDEKEATDTEDDVEAAFSDDDGEVSNDVKNAEAPQEWPDKDRATVSHDANLQDKPKGVVECKDLVESILSAKFDKDPKDIKTGKSVKAKCDKPSPSSSHESKTESSSERKKHRSSSKDSTHSSSHSRKRQESESKSSSGSEKADRHRSHKDGKDKSNKHSDGSHRASSSSKSSHKSSSSSTPHKSSSHKSSSHKSSSSSSHKSSSSNKSSSHSSHRQSSESLHKSSSHKHSSHSSDKHKSRHKSENTTNGVHRQSSRERKHSEGQNYKGNQSDEDNHKKLPHKDISDADNLSNKKRKHRESHKTSTKVDLKNGNVFDNLQKALKISGSEDQSKEQELLTDLFGEDSDAEMQDVSSKQKAQTVDDELDDEVDGAMIAFLEDEFTEEDPYDECLKIFQEEVPRKPSKPVVHKVKEEEEDETEPVGKRRTAHLKATQSSAYHRTAKANPQSRPTPAQVMYNRFKQMQQKAEKSKRSGQVSGNTGKERVARLPSNGRTAGAIMKKCVSESPDGSTILSTSKGKREARVPKQMQKKVPRPTIPTEFGSKVPSSIRQTYLNRIIDECLKIYPGEEDAFDRALSEEKAVYGRSSTKMVYINVAINAIKKLRSEADVHKKIPESPKGSKNHWVQSHEATLGGAKAAVTSFTVKRSGPVKQIGTIKGVELYKRLSAYILNEEQLVENGFPRPSPNNPGAVVINKENPNSKALSLHEKLCVRCGKVFMVFPNGKYARDEECEYHWGKSWKKRIAGSWEQYYTCCQGDSNSKGCHVGVAHVHESNRLEDLTGYMRTIPSSPPLDGDYGVYSLDCEMVYTSAGSELARVTVIGADLQPVFEKIVQPDNPVIDYNTRFSGLKEEDLLGVTATIRDVQAVLLSLFTDKTILMGHSLESDFMALKLVHNTVVDTSVVFPHKLGRPYKRALRTLMGEYMNKIIQNDVEGHDSQEDAAACMELMMWKIKEDAQKDARRS